LIVYHSGSFTPPVFLTNGSFGALLLEKKYRIKKQHPCRHPHHIDAVLTTSLMADASHVPCLSCTEVVFDISKGFQPLSPLM